MIESKDPNDQTTQTTFAWPQVPDPTDVPSMRYYLLSRIDAIESHPFLIPLSPLDRRVLEAQRKVYENSDVSVNFVLSALHSFKKE